MHPCSWGPKEGLRCRDVTVASLWRIVGVGFRPDVSLSQSGSDELWGRSTKINRLTLHEETRELASPVSSRRAYLAQDTYPFTM